MKTDSEYLELLTHNLSEIGTLTRADGSRFYSGKIALWRPDIRTALDDMETVGWWTSHVENDQIFVGYRGNTYRGTVFSPFPLELEEARAGKLAHWSESRIVIDQSSIVVAA